VVYTLDALDRQITRASGGATTTYTYSGTGEILAKAQTGAGTPTSYASSPGGPLSQRTGTDPATTRIYLPDLHGDLVGLAATSGSNPMKGTAMYSPWGVPGTRTGESTILGFQSDMTDPSTGQVDAGVRRYEPVLGRFSTADPLLGDLTDPPSLNRYSYGVDAPVSFTDPTGLRPQCLNCTRQEEQAIVQAFAQGQTQAAQQGTGAYSPATNVPSAVPLPPLPRGIRLPDAVYRGSMIWLGERNWVTTVFAGFFVDSSHVLIRLRGRDLLVEASVAGWSQPAPGFDVAFFAVTAKLETTRGKELDLARLPATGPVQQDPRRSAQFEFRGDLPHGHGFPQAVHFTFRSSEAGPEGQAVFFIPAFYSIDLLAG
jgi:RHS repeat-associated protein